MVKTDAAPGTFLSLFYSGGGRERLRGPVLYQTPRGALVRYGGHGVRERGVKEMKSQEEKSKLR